MNKELAPNTAIIPFTRPTYSAKLTAISADGIEFKMAGTLDGYVDFYVKPSDRRGQTLSLTRDSARALIAGLNTTLQDIEANCLFERDALLERT